MTNKKGWVASLNVKHKKIEMCCVKHKTDYHTMEIIFHGKMRFSSCPKCFSEELRELNDEHAKNMALERFNIFLTQQGRIPPRHIKCTFDNYITTCDGQKKAKQTAENYARDILNNKSGGLMLSGRPGNGKNHLACAIAINCLKKGRKAQIWTLEAMIDAIRDTYGATTGKTTRQVVNEFKSLHLLIIDEIKRYDEKENRLLFDIINDRYTEEKPTIVISNLEFNALEKALGEPIVRRLREGGGKRIIFDWDSYS